MRGLAITLDGERVGVRSGGRWRYAPLSQVVVTPTGIHVGGNRVPLRMGGMSAMFDEPSLRRSIIDRLRMPALSRPSAKRSRGSGHSADSACAPRWRSSRS